MIGQPEVAAESITLANQASARGLVYPIQSIPQSSGLYGFGVACADLDRDGDDDIVAVGRLNGQVGVFRNNGLGYFANVSTNSGIAALPQASAIAIADLDGDRLPDIVLTQVNQASRIYRNLGSLQFEPMQLEASLQPGTPAKAVSLADIDRDGDLDLFLASYATSNSPPPSQRSRLYRNDRSALVDLAPAIGLNRPARSFLGVFSDIDLDGDQDLYVSNDRGHLSPLFEENQLWRNDAGGFTEISSGSGADVACFSMGTACGDFDGNGFPDFLVTNIPTSEAPVFGVNPLMLGQGDGTFVRAESLWGVEDLETGWGALFVDLDDDSHLDLYVNHQLASNKLWRNPGLAPAVLVPNAGGAGGAPTRWSYSSVSSDIDNDGDLDLIVSDLGANLYLYINSTTAAPSSVRLRLEGVDHNTDAIGARVEARIGKRTVVREIHAGGVGYLGQNTLALHFGTRLHGQLDSAIVHFPDGAVRSIGRALPGLYTIVHPALLGDADGNGDLSGTDREALSACIAASGVPNAACMRFDFNGDLAVNTADAPLFEEALLRRRCDLDHDGAVTARDLALLLTNWGESGAGDLDESGVVGDADVAILIAYWNAS
ncbi:MAG: hypothetical protein RLY21_2111 [Planctomycetota bacterium]